MYKSKHKLKSISNNIKSATLSDFSSGLTPQDFQISPVSHYGISGTVISMGFDPVQSLLALGNNQGEVYVFGQKGVEIVFKTSRPEPVLYLKFIKNVFLVAVTASSILQVYSLESKQSLTECKVPGNVSIVESDPSLDFIYLGLDTGVIMIYDVVKGYLTPHKITNLQKTHVIRKSWNHSATPHIDPTRIDNSIRSLQVHPRDIGVLLIAYSKTVVLYSVTERKIKKEFDYEVPPGAPGGDLTNVETSRQPDVVKALFHPNGLNILTCHEDGSLVFWDTNNGTLIQARTLFDTDVDKPQSGLFNNVKMVQPMRYNKITQIEWVCEANPENTSLLIAGGDSIKSNNPNERETNLNLTRIDFGTTPKYSITSYEKMSEFYSNPKNLKIFPISQKSSIRSFLPLPASSPFFAGNHNPNVIFVLLENGIMEVLRYPYGNSIHSSSILPPSLSWVHPELTCLSAIIAPRTQWMGILQTLESERKKKIARQNGASDFYDETILTGGAASTVKQRVFTEGRSVIISGHSDGTVKLWDGSRSELDEISVIEIDTSFGLGQASNPSPVNKVSFSGHTTDLIISNDDGDTILYKFGNNRLYDPNITRNDYDLDSSLTMKLKKKNAPSNSHSLIVNVENNIPAYIHKGFLPIIMIRAPRNGDGPKLTVTALKNSNIEFAAIAYNDGQIMVVDRRVSDIIFMENINKISSKRKSTGSLSYVTSIEFGIMKGSEDAKYSSILMFLGTSVGNLITFQIVPGSSPNSRSRFQIKFLSCVDADNSKIRNIIPINADNGASAVAKTQEFAQLGSGVLIKGLILTVSSFGIRLFKSPTHKSANVNFQNSNSGEIVTADICRVRPVNDMSISSGEVTVMSVLFENGQVKFLSIPSLNEITTLALNCRLNRAFATQSTVLLNGDILIRNDKTEGSLVHITRSGSVRGGAEADSDLLFNFELKIPQRPTFNSLQWARGSKVTTLDDLLMVFEGERRPRTKYPKEAGLAENSMANSALQTMIGGVNGSSNDSNPGPSSDPYGGGPSRSYTSSSNSSAGNNKGWGFDMSNLQRSLNNTYKGIEDRFNEAGNNIAEQYNETVEDTKNNMMKSMIKSKFSF
ncbi:putative Rab GTPase-binding protein [Saccharomycopsis crataegensis]|uniref:Rab GTPase-binding protein n=1 Tax=Saccharomycopsis crataegensis TaxID=43959 RepID=A0AAV5QSH6_9ASCO|nr:putative Rab GTPase-binding protein [Saccharomycopsis crataegensis]